MPERRRIVRRVDSSEEQMKHGFPAALAVILVACATHAHSQTYPTRSIRMIVPFAPGGTADLVGRPLAQKLGDVLGQTVIVDNRGGAGGVVGATLAAKSPADGYTVLLGSSGALTISPSLSKLTYDPTTDFAPIGMVAVSQFVLVVHPSVPAKDARGLIALARQRPGALRYGSAGTGNVGHLAAELMKSLAKIDMVHVPYKGAAPMTVDLLSGQVDLGFPGLASLVPHIKSGRVRALAVTGSKRSGALPDVPTLDESALPGYETITFWGLLLPGKAPPDLVQRLNGAVNEVMKQPELRETYSRAGNDPTTSTPEAFAARIRADIGKWAKLIASAGIKEE
jgi:tripartite-type tricarboxylate transporter receptor subunit TctC